MNLKNPYEE
jgi:hypothetical protein